MSNPFEKSSTSVPKETISKPYTREELKEGPTEEQGQTTDEVVKYGSEVRQKQIKEQTVMIREWAKKRGFYEGEDYLIIEDIKDVVGEEGDVVPHETKTFYMAIHEKYYREFRNYFMSEYKNEMHTKDPKNHARLDYSWGGRFCVGWAGVPCDTVAASDIENRIIPTHHKEFKIFFKDKTGFDFPTAERLNPTLKEMSKKGLAAYEKALVELIKLKKEKALSDDGYGLIDSVKQAIKILDKARGGKAVEELPNELPVEMPIEMRTYADLTYNAEDIANFDRVEEITSVDIPQEARIDKMFDRYNFDRNQMEQICKDFSEYLMTKRDI